MESQFNKNIIFLKHFNFILDSSHLEEKKSRKKKQKKKMMSADFKKKSKNKNKLSIKIPKRKVFRTTEPLIAIFMWGINYTVCLLYLF